MPSDTSTHSVHSFNAVSSLLMICEFTSTSCDADVDVSIISDIAATAFATT